MRTGARQTEQDTCRVVASYGEAILRAPAKPGEQKRASTLAIAIEAPAICWPANYWASGVWLGGVLT